jgi:arsenate reductase
LLEAEGVAFRYRESREDRLSETEVRRIVELLGVHPGDLLRARDPQCRELGLQATDPAGEIVAAMAAHPTLLQRPIGILGDRAVLGRPPERLLKLAQPPDPGRRKG